MMSRKGLVVYGATAGAAILIAAFMLDAARKKAAPQQHSSSGRVAQNSAVEHELRSARTELAALRRVVQRLESRSDHVERSLTDLKESDVQNSGNVETEVQAEPVKDEVVPERPSGLEAHFRFADGYRAYATSEPRDSEWARGKETELQRFFVSGGGMQGYSLTSVECKTTICALELLNESAPDPAAEPESVRQYMGRVPFTGQSYWAPSEHGLLVVLSREGKELPTPASL